MHSCDSTQVKREDVKHSAGLLVIVLMTLTACGSDAGSLTSCEAAHERAGSVDEMSDVPSDYFPTYSACSGIAEWNAAARSHSGLDASQIQQWPATQCATEPSLQATNVCSDIPMPTREATFEVVCPDGFTTNVRQGSMTAAEAEETFC